MGIKFLSNAILSEGKKARVHYSKGGYTKESGLTDDVITIYAKDYGNQLPKELGATNDSDMMTDYFSTDIARLTPKSKYYKDVENAFMKAKEHDRKIMEKRRLKFGW